MTASHSPAATATTPVQVVWPKPAPNHGLGTRLATASLHAIAGLLVGASALGIAVAWRLADRGAVPVAPADVALLNAILPAVIAFGAIGLAHLVAALGIVVGSRTGAALGVVAGLADVVAGSVMIAIALGVSRNRDDGLGIGASFVVAGILLAAAALVADRRTHEPADAA